MTGGSKPVQFAGHFLESLGRFAQSAVHRLFPFGNGGRCFVTAGTQFLEFDFQYLHFFRHLIQFINNHYSGHDGQALITNFTE